MKLEIYKEKARPGGIVRLRLVECGGGEVSLAVVDEYGSVECFIVDITADGRFCRHRGIDPRLGFDLDSEGSIKLGE